jgi:hypothetical protein
MNSVGKSLDSTDAHSIDHPFYAVPHENVSAAQSCSPHLTSWSIHPTRTSLGLFVRRRVI